MPRGRSSPSDDSEQESLLYPVISNKTSMIWINEKERAISLAISFPYVTYIFSFRFSFSWLTTLATAGSALVGDRRLVVQLFTDDRGKNFVDESSFAILGGV